MARQPQTKEQIAARVAKSKATKAKNKQAALARIGFEPRKIKKVRAKREMTPEQKKAAVSRLAAAREAKGPSTNSLIDESVRNLPDEDTFSLKNVRSWIKLNKDLLAGMRGMKDSKDAKERMAFANTTTYVANLEAYLRNGIYVDMFFGDRGQTKVQYYVKKSGMAYYANGLPKRTVGYFYEDVGLYTQELESDDNDRGQAVPNKSKIRKAG
jgi:hypothetical protein